MHHQLPWEVLVQGAVARAQGLGEARLSSCPTSSSPASPILPSLEGLFVYSVRVLVAPDPGPAFPDGQPASRWVLAPTP